MGASKANFERKDTLLSSKFIQHCIIDFDSEPDRTERRNNDFGELPLKDLLKRESESLSDKLERKV